MLADGLTVSRMLFSLLLLPLPPSSYLFSALYLLCGVTDVLDGFAARKTHTESERGAMLDSAADLVFAFSYAVKVLPLLSVPLWIWICTAVIAAIKAAGILLTGRSSHRPRIAHSFGNRLTGILLFLLPLWVFIADVKYGAALACLAAAVTAVRELILSLGPKGPF